MRRAKKGSAGDRVGGRRRAELAERTGRLAEVAERIRALEEAHVVPRTRQPEPGLGPAVTAWARGAPFGVALDLATAEVGDLAPGDFVRTVRQLADLVGQVAVVARGPEVTRAAEAALGCLLRDVVAAGGLPASHPVGGPDL